VLQGRLYSALPGRSGLVLTVSTVFGVAGSGLPLLLGLLAQRVGLQSALWVLVLGPLALLVGLIGVRNRQPEVQQKP
jgi:FSR family fosmidomycin resistance protein-like MFS transporter